MKLLFVSLILLAGLVVIVRAVSNRRTNGKLNIGDALPAVAAEDQDGNLVQLTAAGKSGYTLVYFYPKAMTPGCTAQACSLRNAYDELQNKGVKIFGVSLDTVDSQKKFQAKEHLPFVLLSDRQKKVTSAFGVPLILNSLAARQAYLFKEGKLVWMDTHASTGKQASDVLEVLAQQP
jgi:thioredoxin-dependent peroxiredoxin